MSFPNVSGDAIALTDNPNTVIRKTEFLRQRAVGKSLQRKDETTAYTPTTLDLGFHMAYNAAGDVNWTLNADFPAGAWLMVSQLGLGRVTFVAGTGATVNCRTTARTLSQHSQVRADVISNSTGSAAVWQISGDVG